MPTLVIPRQLTADSEAIWRASIQAGWEVECIGGFTIDGSLRGREPVLYADMFFADAVRDLLELALLEPTEDWLPCLPERFVKRQVVLATLAEACALESSAFVKPPGEKWFAAGVYATGAELVVPEERSHDLAVLIAEPVVFDLEIRLFVLEREVLTWSAYLRDGVIARRGNTWPIADSDAAEVLQFAREFLRAPDVEIPPATVVDIGRIVGRGWAVVEANAVWLSALCGGDPQQVIRSLLRASVSANAVRPEDARWVRPSKSFV